VPPVAPAWDATVGVSGAPSSPTFTTGATRPPAQAPDAFEIGLSGFPRRRRENESPGITTPPGDLERVLGGLDDPENPNATGLPSRTNPSAFTSNTGGTQ
jgi:hypothetical protein